MNKKIIWQNYMLIFKIKILKYLIQKMKLNIIKINQNKLINILKNNKINLLIK